MRCFVALLLAAGPVGTAWTVNPGLASVALASSRTNRSPAASNATSVGRARSFSVPAGVPMWVGPTPALASGRGAAVCTRASIDTREGDTTRTL